MTWDEFRDRLQATLRGLTERCYLIVEGTDGYVQFACGADLLAAEAAGPAHVQGAAAHPDDDPALLAAGWTPPGDPRENWTSQLPLPALTAEYAALAERCVVALRDGYRLAGPDVLGYRAWREPEPAGVTWTPERRDQLDPGADPLPLPALGLPAS